MNALVAVKIILLDKNKLNPTHTNEIQALG